MVSFSSYSHDLGINGGWLTPSAFHLTQSWVDHGVVSRSIGTLGVSSAALMDATGHLGLCLTSTFHSALSHGFYYATNPLRGYPYVYPLYPSSSMFHIRQATQYVALAALNPVLWFATPEVQLSVLGILGVRRAITTYHWVHKQKDTAQEAMVLSLLLAAAIGGGLYYAQQEGLIDLTGLATWFNPAASLPVPTAPEPALSPLSGIAASIVALTAIAMGHDECCPSLGALRKKFCTSGQPSKAGTDEPPTYAESSLKTEGYEAVPPPEAAPASHTSLEIPDAYAVDG